MKSLLRRLRSAPRPVLGSLLELVALVAWTLFVTRSYLNFDPAVVPAGREFLAVIQIHHIWTAMRECGACAMWYGSVGGGYPAFVDPNGSALHPLVILATFAAGVLSGAKLALVGSFLMAGLAQWWLGWTLGVGRVARLWSAAVAVAGGHLASRMELGALPLIVSAAACALVLPAILRLRASGSRRDAALLGIVLALAAVAGNGYLQVGLLFALPATFALAPPRRSHAALLARRSIFAAVVGLLLAAPFLVPFLHFLPEFQKAHNPAFPGAQNLVHIPLKQLIRDHRFYVSDALGKLPYPSHYVLYIGWLPVLLAIVGLGVGRDVDERRRILFLASFTLLVFLVASAAPLALLAWTFPNPAFVQLVSGVRFPAFMAALAVAPILGLAALALDRIVAAPWLRPRARPVSRKLHFLLRWLLAIPLLLSLADVWAFNRPWLVAMSLHPGVQRVLETLRTPDLQWVNPPRGEHIYVEPAVRMWLKLATNYYLTWHWRDRPPPEPLREANLVQVPEGMALQSMLEGVPIYTPPNPAFHDYGGSGLFFSDVYHSPRTTVNRVRLAAATSGREYATVAHADGSRTVCSAQGVGGDIDVSCDLPQPGVLTVKENNWSGWGASLRGQPVPMKADRWLSIAVPAGSVQVQFRFRPWDVPLGLLLSVAGAALVAYAVARPD